MTKRARSLVVKGLVITADDRAGDCQDELAGGIGERNASGVPAPWVAGVGERPLCRGFSGPVHGAGPRPGIRVKAGYARDGRVITARSRSQRVQLERVA